MSAHFHYESHGNHPLSFVGFLLALGGFLSAALWLVHMAAGNNGYAALFAGLTLVAFACAISIFFSRSAAGTTTARSSQTTQKQKPSATSASIAEPGVPPTEALGFSLTPVDAP